MRGGGPEAGDGHAHPLAPQLSPLTQMWQQVATSLVAVVVAMLAFWFVEGREYVTRAEASEMIARESPYIRDRNMVLDRLGEMVEINRQLTQAIQDLRVEITELRIERRSPSPAEGK